MKYIVILVLASACDYVNSDQIKKATELCSKNDGIKRMRALHNDYDVTRVVCNNGAEFFEPTFGIKRKERR